MEPLKHECGIALVRLLKPLGYYEAKYGTWMYGLNKLYLMMEKQHNRGQEGAGMACLKLNAEPGEEFIFRERAMGTTAISEIFAAAHRQIADNHHRDVADTERLTPFAGEIYMGHLRYSTTGKRGLQYVHPFLRRDNWLAKNLCICANFNMTNVDEIFATLATKGQHPRMMSDTYLLLEQLGHRLDRESERCFNEAMALGLTDQAITKYIEQHINVANVLSQSAPVWDGGYALCGVTGSGESFVLRDPWGIRPCFWYADDEVIAVASERPVIQTTFDREVSDIHELLPGQALIIRRDGTWRTEQILTPRNLAACSFERIYFSRGSDVDIYRERKEMGHQLVDAVYAAVNGEVENTVLSYIPNTAETSYYGLCEGFDARGFKVRREKVVHKDIKMRTFIAEGAARNDLAAHVYDISYGSIHAGEDNLVVIDDSIVRGTTLRQSIIRILDRLHPKRIVIVSAAPQVRYPDYYGIDMSSMEQFIAFRAAIALLKERGMEHIITDVYERCKAVLDNPATVYDPFAGSFVQAIYAPFTQEEVSAKIAEMLTPVDIKTEVKIIFQTVDGLHASCPDHPGDWYFTGDYPTPGGLRMLYRAFVHWYEQR
ncbi:MAG: amidophosphoribosyltransferase [Bacteroidales bacterium]|nr:amidophosphoribosyltransferase [Bacteroidales bacterium]